MLTFNTCLRAFDVYVPTCPNSIHAFVDFIKLNSVADKLNIPSSFRAGRLLELAKEAELKVTSIGSKVSTNLVIRTSDPEKNSLIYLAGEVASMNLIP